MYLKKDEINPNGILTREQLDSVDLKHLKSIVAYNYREIDRSIKFRQPNHFKFTRVEVYSIMKQLCDFYQVKLCFFNNENIHYHYYNNNEIYLNIYYLNKCLTGEIIATFCHELAHKIQSLIYSDFESVPFRYTLEYELIAEKLGMYIANYYFADEVGRFKEYEFNSYQDRNSILDLYKRNKDIILDEKKSNDSYWKRLYRKYKND